MSLNKDSNIVSVLFGDDGAIYYYYRKRYFYASTSESRTIRKPVATVKFQFDPSTMTEDFMQCCTEGNGCVLLYKNKPVAMSSPDVMDRQITNLAKIGIPSETTNTYSIHYRYLQNPNVWQWPLAYVRHFKITPSILADLISKGYIFDGIQNYRDHRDYPLELHQELQYLAKPGYLIFKDSMVNCLITAQSTELSTFRWIKI
jgi:hypothetical protein